MTESSHGEGECLVTERSTGPRTPWSWRSQSRDQEDEGKDVVAEPVHVVHTEPMQYEDYHGEAAR